MADNIADGITFSDRYSSLVQALACCGSDVTNVLSGSSRCYVTFIFDAEIIVCAGIIKLMKKR